MSKTHPTAVAARAVTYARVSTFDQEPENQLLELRRYVEARGWTAAAEYVDRGVNGAKDRRPALDRLLLDVKRRRFDVLVVWRLDRLGRSVRHLVNFISDLNALGIGFASLGEAIDTNTPSGRLQLHILSALAEFERERIRERVMSGLARARAHAPRWLFAGSRCHPCGRVPAPCRWHGKVVSPRAQDRNHSPAAKGHHTR